MQYDISNRFTYSALNIQLEAGERFVGDSGAMAWMSSNILTETSTRGGVLQGLKRKMLAGESLFQNTYTAENGPGDITFVPGASGDIDFYELEDGELMLERGAYLASEESVECQSKWEGMKGLFNEGLFALKVVGSGLVFFHSYGRLEEIEVDGHYTVDNGYAVAWEPTLEYRVTRGAKIRSFLFSDQLILSFSGRGRVWVQSRSPHALAAWVHPFRRVKVDNDD